MNKNEVSGAEVLSINLPANYEVREERDDNCFYATYFSLYRLDKVQGKREPEEQELAFVWRHEAHEELCNCGHSEPLTETEWHSLYEGSVLDDFDDEEEAANYLVKKAKAHQWGELERLLEDGRVSLKELCNVNDGGELDLEKLQEDESLPDATPQAWIRCPSDDAYTHVRFTALDVEYEPWEWDEAEAELRYAIRQTLETADTELFRLQQWAKKNEGKPFIDHIGAIPACSDYWLVVNDEGKITGEVVEWTDDFVECNIFLLVSGSCVALPHGETPDEDDPVVKVVNLEGSDCLLRR